MASQRKSWMITLLILAVVAVLGFADQSVRADPPTREQSVRNPVREGSADPFLFTDNGWYYLTYTTVDRVVLVKARSVLELATAEPVTIWTDDNPERCCHMWAPEIHKIGDRWYVYYTAAPGDDIGDHRMYVLESEGPDVMGPYHFKAKLATQDDFSIDGTVLTMPDGRMFHVWSGHLDGSPQSLWIAPMSNPWTLSGEPSLLSEPTEAWEQHEGVVNEGAVPLIKNGRVFLVYSGSQCKSADYALGLLEYTGGPVTEQGSWTKTGPVFRRSDENHVFGPGHNSLFTSPDGTELWNAYHAVTSADGSPYGSCGGDRSMRIDKVNFTEDGTPLFGEPSASWDTLPLPSGDPGTAGVAPGTYRLAPLNNTANALQVAGSGQDCSPAAGTPVEVRPTAEDDCQRWKIRPLRDGTHSIVNIATGKALESEQCSADGTRVVQGGERENSECQRWYIDTVRGGYRISAKIGGRVLDVNGCSTSPGTRVGLWTYWQGSCQKWVITA